MPDNPDSLRSRYIREQFALPGDPTPLTTQQLWREVSALKELVFARLDAMQRMFDKEHEDLVRVPTDVQKSVGSLRELHDERFGEVEQGIVYQAALRDEKFSGVATTFGNLQKMIEATNASSRLSVEAALQAAKEAVGKSEIATAKAIDQLGLLIATGTKAVDEKIDDVKERMTRLESRAEGGAERVKAQHASGSFNIGLVGMIVGILGFVMGVAALILKLK